METMKMMTRATWKLVPLLVQSRIQTVKALYQKQDHRKIMPVTRQHLNKSTRKSKQTTMKVDAGTGGDGSCWGRFEDHV